jgi:hypothetical protein
MKTVELIPFLEFYKAGTMTKVEILNIVDRLREESFLDGKIAGVKQFADAYNSVKIDKHGN